jgi:hypothetical protein
VRKFETVMLDARESSLLKDLVGLVLSICSLFRIFLKGTECWKVSLDCSASLVVSASFADLIIAFYSLKFGVKFPFVKFSEA